MDGPEANPVLDGTTVDLRAYFRALYRWRWLIAALMLGTVLLTAAYTLRQTRLYQASASVIIDPTAPRILDDEVGKVMDSGSGTYWFNKEYYETQFKVIVSRAVSERVVDKLKLRSDRKFLGIKDQLDGPALEAAIQGADAVSLLQSRITVAPLKDSRLTHIVVTDPDPNRAALLANEVAEAYIAEDLDLRSRTTQNASRWLEERLATLETSAQQSELGLFEFKRGADMLSTSLEDRANIISQRLIAINEALTDVSTRIARLRARVTALRQARSAIQGGDIPFAVIPGVDEKEARVGVTRELRIEYFQLRGECAEFANRYLPDHPKLAACTERKKVLEQEIVREFDGIVANAEVELQEAVGSERNLITLLTQAKKEAFEVNKKNIEYDQLKRESENNQRLYDMVLKRLTDIELSGLVRTSNVRILDRARPNLAPVKPNVKLNLTLAVLFGLGAAVGLALLLEVLDSTIKTREQVEEAVKVTFLGILPRVPASESTAGELIVHRQPHAVASECCRSLRANLLFMSPDKPRRRILVTSSGPQDGKTTTACNLAATMAENGSRVLLVDADMRRPRVHKVFNLNNGAGLSSLIVGQGTLEETVRTTEIPNVSVLTCGPVPPNPAELLHTESFAALLAQMASAYDWVIIDSPPVGVVADALAIATQVDGTLLVFKAGRTSRDAARRTRRALTDVKAPILGAVLNDVDVSARGYSSYYGYSGYGYYSEQASS